MGVHHMAFGTRDVEATHRFYTEAMGFELMKVEVGKTDGGWAKHLFYSTGEPRDQMIAFWDLHDPTLPAGWSGAISTGQGLPIWVNHLAFSAADLADLARRRERWLANGHDVMEIDHDWCCLDLHAGPERHPGRVLHAGARLHRRRPRRRAAPAARPAPARPRRREGHAHVQGRALASSGAAASS